MKTHEERAEEILQKRDKYIAVQKAKRNRMARIAVIVAVVILTTAVISAIAILNRGKSSAPEAVSGTRAEYRDGVIGENKAEAADGEADGVYHGMFKEGMAAAADEYAIEGKGYSISDGMATPEYPECEAYINAEAGTLTAGEWKDAEALKEWLEKLSENGDFAKFVKERKLDTSDYVKVTVKGGDVPCFNATVTLLSGEEAVFTAKTDINGIVYLFRLDNGGAELSVKVGENVIAVGDGREVNVQAEDAGIEAKKLDLMLVVDTTGSMSDELEYLKAELVDMVERISKEDESFAVRVSVNFYRDEGDEYVVKYYDFREDVNECLEQIKEQSAEGGGDYPEAVHTALDNAVNGHEWREDAIKICFIVLDAPPHSESEVQGINETLRKIMVTAAEKGIRIIPVASSGVDDETEFLLRSYALVTGGTYVFLTDDSGVGYGHKDPDVSEDVTVEALNDCMVRIVCEYCGIYSGEKVPYTPPYHQ